MNNDKKYKISYIDDNKFKMNKDDFDSFTKLYCSPVLVDNKRNTYIIYETKIIIKEKSVKTKKLKCINCGNILGIYPEDYSIPWKDLISKDFVYCNNPILVWV